MKQLENNTCEMDLKMFNITRKHQFVNDMQVHQYHENKASYIIKSKFAMFALLSYVIQKPPVLSFVRTLSYSKIVGNKVYSHAFFLL